eukprot:Gb_29634 [translate_table: standard]
MILAESVANVNNISLGWWDKVRGAPPCLSDVVWTAVGEFFIMDIMRMVDRMISVKGLTLTIAPFSIVCVVLFATLSSSIAHKYNIFIIHIGCSTLGVIMFSLFSPSWIV